MIATAPVSCAYHAEAVRSMKKARNHLASALTDLRRGEFTDDEHTWLRHRLDVLEALIAASREALGPPR